MRAVLLIVAAAAFLATTSAMPVVDDGEQDSKACAMCELILTRAAALMAGRNFTEQGFEQGLDRLCTKLPPDASKECQQFVALYGEDIFRTLDGEISPQQACTVLRVCNNSTLPIASDDGDDSSAEEEEQDQQQVKQSKVKGNPKVCAVCQIILKLVDSYVDTSGMNEDQFEQALDTICTRLPVKIQSECQALVTLYGDQIWQAIDGDVPPAQICAEIGVCPNTTMSNDGGDDSQDTPLAQVPADISNLLLPGQAAVQQIQMAAEAAALAQAAGIVEGKGNEPCAVCELVMRYISKVVQDKQLTEEQFDKDLDTLCSALPANLQQQCQSLVELYGDDLWKAIDGQVPPAQVCTQLHICN